MKHDRVQKNTLTFSRPDRIVIILPRPVFKIYNLPYSVAIM